MCMCISLPSLFIFVLSNGVPTSSLNMAVMPDCCDCTGCYKIVKAGVVCSPVVLSPHPFAVI
jgi:hypothetical protein